MFNDGVRKLYMLFTRNAYEYAVCNCRQARMVSGPGCFRGLCTHPRLFSLGAQYVNFVAAPLHGDFDLLLALDGRWSLRSAWPPNLQHFKIGCHALAALIHSGNDDS